MAQPYLWAVMNTIRTLLLIIGIYYLLKFLGRLLLPIMVRKVADKAQASMNERMRQHFEQQQAAQRTVHTEGDVSVQKKSKGRSREEEGEYVSFEEVKD